MKTKAKKIKKMVRKGYAKVAMTNGNCCGSSSCCGGGASAEELSQIVGYSNSEIKAVPAGANLGLGCGNPVALASLKTGETVLDLGSGAGFDAFLASIKVGKKGKVIGVDMTPEMVAKAKANSKKGSYTNVEFRLGEIENLPVADEIIDAIISNCVINLSPDKQAVFNESFRVLKAGGRLMVSDLVLEKKLPPKIKRSVEAYVGCIAGASMKKDYLAFIKKAGFKKIEVVASDRYLDYPVVSIKVKAIKL